MTTPNGRWAIVFTQDVVGGGGKMRMFMPVDVDAPERPALDIRRQFRAVGVTAMVSIVIADRGVPRVVQLLQHRP